MQPQGCSGRGTVLRIHHPDQHRILRMQQIFFGRVDAAARVGHCIGGDLFSTMNRWAREEESLRAGKRQTLCGDAVWGEQAYNLSAFFSGTA